MSTAAASGDRLQVGVLPILALIAGATAPFSFELIGDVYVAELLLPVVAIVALAMGPRGRRPVKTLRIFLASGLLMLLGYVVSDLVAHTEIARFVRGWARVTVLITDFSSLALIVTADKRSVWWYLLGSSLATLGFDVVSRVPLTDWKFKYGDAALTLVACSAYLVPAGLLLILLIAIGLVCVYLDSRSQGGFALASAVVTWSRLGKSRSQLVGSGAYARLVVVAVLLMAVLWIAVSQTQSAHAERRDWSNIGRFSALTIGLRAIAKSPFVGYGSWGQGTEQFAEDLERDLAATGQEGFRTDVVLAHSQILQSWMEGGLLGGGFFLLYGYYVARGIYHVAARRPVDRLTPIYVLVLIMALWHLFMSPFGGDHRLGIAVAIAVLCSLEREQLDPSSKQGIYTVGEQAKPTRFPNLLR